MNNNTRTIRSEEITIDMRVLTIMEDGRKNGEIYLAAIAPDMELTVITLDEAPDILPCFDEDDACVNIPDSTLMLCYNPAQVLELGGKHYLTGPVILMRIDMDGDIISLSMDELYRFQKYLAGHSITLIEILTKLQENSQKNHDEIFTRLYRYLLRPDIYFIAYQHLYSNKGAGTKGVNDDTADGFSEQYVTAIIEALRTGSYEPKPVRRTYIQKKNGKLRPLGLPVFADKLVQEAIRMILEAIYEPIFSIYSHGFRPGRSCHTALAMIKHEFTGAKWFIEGDIKGCFDNIDHSTLIGVLNRKIKDARFLNLIRMFLKSGYMEDWNFHETYSGCPQGGIISPILANVYLNELDRYITQLKKEFDHGYNPRNFTEEYNAIRHKRDDE